MISIHRTNSLMRARRNNRMIIFDKTFPHKADKTPRNRHSWFCNKKRAAFICIRKQILNLRIRNFFRIFVFFLIKFIEHICAGNQIRLFAKRSSNSTFYADYIPMRQRIFPRRKCFRRNRKIQILANRHCALRNIHRINSQFFISKFRAT